MIDKIEQTNFCEIGNRRIAQKLNEVIDFLNDLQVVDDEDELCTCRENIKMEGRNICKSCADEFNRTEEDYHPFDNNYKNPEQKYD